MVGAALPLCPRGAAESRSQSGVTAAAVSTPGGTDTIISPPENGKNVIKKNIRSDVSVFVVEECGREGEGDGGCCTLTG